MPERRQTGSRIGLGTPLFATTHWSVVLAAGKSETSESAGALENLCRAYWYPLYAFLRRQGYEVADAQDLTQGFFSHILSRGFLQRASRDKGKFRSFLLGSLKFFLADELAKLRARKRGGGAAVLRLDQQAAEERYLLEPVELMDAEKLFERRWAITLLERVLGRLESEFLAADKGPLFEQLRQFLLGDRGTANYREVASSLGTTEGAIKVAVHRLRQRYRKLFRDEIAQTVADPADAEQEMKHVFAAICR